MNFDFADILLEVIELGASDLHLTAGSPPMVRERGKLQRRSTTRSSTRRTRARSSTRSSTTTSASGSRPTGRSTSRTRSRARARFRVNAFFQRASIGAVHAARSRRTSRRSTTLGLPPVLAATSPASRAASCSSPARPARASPRRSPR